MNTLSLKISGCPRGHASVLIDGKKPKLKFNQYGNFEGTYTTDKSSIELSVYKYLEINGKLWFTKQCLGRTIKVNVCFHSSSIVADGRVLVVHYAS